MVLCDLGASIERFHHRLSQLDCESQSLFHCENELQERSNEFIFRIGLGLLLGQMITKLLLLSLVGLGYYFYSRSEVVCRPPLLHFVKILINESVHNDYVFKS
jgi:hypothetical protein